MALDFTGITPASESRKVNQKRDYYIDVGGKRYRINAPTPCDINFELKIASLYIYEAEQILEQIISFFTPAAFSRVYLDDLEEPMNMKVVFDSASKEDDTEIDQEDYRVVN